ncbi:uncharacterized protein TNCV_4491061 [Trichonephila clavipes]|nr:uncharacterized protein TNCV_4491061 [Trichonephila clavipes]
MTLKSPRAMCRLLCPAPGVENVLFLMRPEIEDREPTRGLLATDHAVLNHGQVTWAKPELAPPLLTTIPRQREEVSALDILNVHRCPTLRLFSGTGLELVTRQAMVRYLYHSASRPPNTHRKNNYPAVDVKPIKHGTVFRYP